MSNIFQGLLRQLLSLIKFLNTFRKIRFVAYKKALNRTKYHYYYMIRIRKAPKPKFHHILFKKIVHTQKLSTKK